MAMIPSAKARARRAAAAGALLVLVTLTWTSGCRDGAGVTAVQSSYDSLPGLIVSGPVAPKGAAGVRGPAGAPPSGLSVVFVSLPPGSVPTGSQATIRDLATGQSVTTVVVDGGFDPVALAGSVGDTLVVDIARSGSAGPIHAWELVKANRPPVVVRTDPPPQKVDVPLNSIMVVVFSAPIDPSTLTTTSVQLLHDGTPVAGTIRFSDATDIRAELHADSLLVSQTTYRLVVNQTIHDVNNLALAAELVVPFTTGTSGPLASLAFDVGPTRTVTGIVITPSVHMTALTSTGIEDPTFTDSVTLVLVAPAGGGSLSGTTTVAAVAGGAAFGDLRIGRAGAGYRLVAMARGLRPDTSVAFDVTDAVGNLPSGRVAFVKWTADSSSVVVMNADGSAPTTVFASGMLSRPTWSPDGARLAFAGWLAKSCTVVGPYDYACQSKVYVANADGSSAGGSGLAHLTDGLYWGSDAPTWSPGGSRIAFTYLFDTIDSPYSIYVMNADGTAQAQVTNPDLYEDDTDPTWSPDGQRLAFTRTVYNAADPASSTSEMWVVGGDGSGLRPLVTGVSAYRPQWSQDGTKIVFHTKAGIAVANADGAGIARLSSNASDQDPTWTPDGRIVFARSVGVNTYKLFLMNADGSGVVMLPQPAGSNTMPAWSPPPSAPAVTRPRGRRTGGES